MKDNKEQIMPTAFDECDMTDCVFRVDHEGTVYARTSAGTVETYTDEHGLKTIADLSRTAKARGVWEDIEAGNYPKMSFAFTVAADHYDPATMSVLSHGQLILEQNFLSKLVTTSTE